MRKSNKERKHLSEYKKTKIEEETIAHANKQEEARRIALLQNVHKDPKEVTGARLVLGYMGIFIMMVGIISLLSLICLIFPTIGKDFYAGKSYVVSSYVARTAHTWKEEASYFWIILVPGISAILLGMFLYSFIFKKTVGKLKGIEDILLILNVWIIAILIFATPFLLARFTPAYNGEKLVFGFTQSIFEATSGLTTTGLTLMTPSNLPRILVMHRTLANFFGGVGLVLLLTSFVSRGGNVSIYSLEGHNDQLLGNLAKSARLIFGIYFGYVAIGTIVLIGFGMSPFDAISYAVSALSTGGFTSQDNSIVFFDLNFSEYWRVVAIKITEIFLMIIGSTNFLIHWMLVRFKWKKAFKHSEFLVFLTCLVIFYPFVFIGLYNSYKAFYLDSTNAGLIGITFINATFEYVSAISTTGLSTLDSAIFADTYGSLPAMTFAVLLMSCFIGGQSGSTSGGLKQSRAAFIILNIHWVIFKNIRRPESVKARFVHRFGEKVAIDDSYTNEANNYLGMYFIAIMLGTLALTCHSFINSDIYSFKNSLFEATSAISSYGVSCGVSNYASIHGHWGALWVDIIEMFLGRLEVTIVILFLLRGIRTILRHPYSSLRKR
jgi:trk system potassium uptake protein TrkH